MVWMISLLTLNIVMVNKREHDSVCHSPARTFVRDNGYLIMVYEASWHRDLEMVCSQDDGSAISAKVGSPGTLEDGSFR